MMTHSSSTLNNINTTELYFINNHFSRTPTKIFMGSAVQNVMWYFVIGFISDARYWIVNVSSWVGMTAADRSSEWLPVTGIRYQRLDIKRSRLRLKVDAIKILLTFITVLFIYNFYKYEIYFCKLVCILGKNILYLW